MFGDNKLALRQTENVLYRPYNADVQRSSAAEYKELFYGEIFDYDRLEIFYHRIAQPKENIADIRALLLAVNDVGLCKNRTSARYSGDIHSLGNYLRIILYLHIKTGHLIFKK